MKFVKRLSLDECNTVMVVYRTWYSSRSSCKKGKITITRRLHCKLKIKVLVLCWNNVKLRGKEKDRGEEGQSHYRYRIVNKSCVCTSRWPIKVELVEIVLRSSGRELVKFLWRLLHRVCSSSRLHPVQPVSRGSSRLKRGEWVWVVVVSRSQVTTVINTEQVNHKYV